MFFATPFYSSYRVEPPRPHASTSEEEEEVMWLRARATITSSNAAGAAGLNGLLVLSPPPPAQEPVMLQPTHMASYMPLHHYYSEEESRLITMRRSPSVISSYCSSYCSPRYSSPKNPRPSPPPAESSSWCHASIITASSATCSIIDDDFGRLSPVPFYPPTTPSSTRGGRYHEEQNELLINDAGCSSTAKVTPFRDTVFDGCPFFLVSLPEKVDAVNQRGEEEREKATSTFDLCVDDTNPFLEEFSNEEDEDNAINKTSDRNHSTEVRIQLCHLIQPSDRKRTTDFTLAIMDQVDVVYLGEDDRQQRNRKLHPTRCPGLACRHCKPTQGMAGRYFPSTMKTFSDPQKTLYAIHKHLFMRCDHCPNSVKLKIIELQKSHKDQNMILAKECGGMRAFYRRVWDSMHDRLNHRTPSKLGRFG